MTIEFALLAASVVLGIVHVIIVAHLQSWQRGYSTIGILMNVAALFLK